MAITPVTGFTLTDASTTAVFNPATQDTNPNDRFEPVRNKENVNGFVNAVQLIEESNRPKEREFVRTDAKDIEKEIRQDGTLEGSNSINIQQIIFEDQQQIEEKAKAGQLEFQKEQAAVLERYSPERSPAEDRRNGPRREDDSRILGSLVDRIV